MIFRDAQKDITGYHAHIYYSPETRDIAAALRQAIDENFNVILGRWRDMPVGPHPEPMYQVAFSTAEFEKLVPWLMINHQNQDIFIHPMTGNDLEDHRDYATWIGNKLNLNLEFFARGLKTA